LAHQYSSPVKRPYQFGFLRRFIYALTGRMGQMDG